VSQGQILYAKVDRTYVIKFAGEVRYTICAPLSAFVDRLESQSDFDDVVIDLTDTEAIDSTNLGTLARIANLVQDRFHHKTTLVSSNEDVNHVLHTMGFYQVFNIDEHPLTEKIRVSDFPAVDEPERRTAKAILDAHRMLASLNEPNRKLFRDVLEALERDSDRSADDPPTVH